MVIFAKKTYKEKTESLLIINYNNVVRTNNLRTKIYRKQKHKNTDYVEI